MQKSVNRMVSVARSVRGFTLLELIISIVLIALIVVITSGGMRMSYRSVDKGERKIESLERYRTSLALIEAQIESAAPLSFEEEAQKRYYFEGTANTMRLTTNYSIWGGQKGYVIVDYTIKSDNNGMKSLYASEGTIGAKNSRETLLLFGLNQIAFEYYFKDPTEDEGVWIEEWNDTTSLPLKVRLRLAEGSSETALIIPMKARGTLTR